MGFFWVFYHDPNVCVCVCVCVGGGSICLGPLPQPLLLTTNNQALLLKGPCAPKSPVTQLKTHEDLLQFNF